MKPVAQIAYGNARIPFEMDPALAEWHVFAPQDEPALAEPRKAFLEACKHPIGTAPLADVVKATDRVVIVTSDGTRPVPNRFLIPWLIEALPAPPEQITVLVGTGTHRANTGEELRDMFGEQVVGRIRIVNHDGYDPDQSAPVGRTAAGFPVRLNREYVHADKRIAVGFIEPHFFAGFSGGAKAVAPGVASADTILHLHRYDLIAHPRSTWGILDGNPIQGAIHETAGLCPPEFLVNVTLNNEKAITGFFAGDYREAHRAGCARVRQRAMVAARHTFPVVVTSNSGYPLDQNLYQSVKGMSAAARIVEEGGTVFLASECRDGIPAGGNFEAMLRESASVEGLDAALRALDAPAPDQWQAQVLAQVLGRCTVKLHSTLDHGTVQSCLLTPIEDLQRAVEEHLRTLGARVPVAVMPEGPITIPFVRRVGAPRTQR